MSHILSLVIRTSERFTDSEIEELQKKLVKRFGRAFFLDNKKFIVEFDNEFLDDDIVELDKEFLDDDLDEDNLYEIILNSVYDTPPDTLIDLLRVSSLLIYLIREGYWVLYGEDCNINPYSEEDVMKLFSHALNMKIVSVIFKVMGFIPNIFWEILKKLSPSE